ncbi:MAG: hypothetical protein ACRDHN_07585 [Thermomicrobiales bacterium]
MQPSALHPFDPAVAETFVLALDGRANITELPGLDRAWSEQILSVARTGYERASLGQERGFHEITAAFGQAISALHPTFQHDGLSLTSWEAQIDRGAGMLLRPPARFLIEAGLDPNIARQLAIRLDFSHGMMGGAYVPPRLVPQLAALLDHRFDRLVKRLVAAEIDPFPHMSLLIEAVNYAQQNNLGLYETLGVVIPDAIGSIPPGARIVMFDRKRLDPELRKRIEFAAKPVKEPSKFAKLLNRSKPSSDDLPSQNGHVHLDE